LIKFRSWIWLFSRWELLLLSWIWSRIFWNN